MGRTLMMIGALFGAMAVLLGAFGAHGLKGIVTAERLAVFETAVRYQFFHALALLFVGLLAQRSVSSLFGLSGWLFVAGVLIFSGSLYALVLSSSRWLGAITPIGGLAMIAGWLVLAVAIWRDGGTL